MSFDITKVANAILYMVNKEMKHLNDKKLSILLFLIDYYHLQEHCTKVFADEYIKDKRNPEPKILGELFAVIANEEDLDEEDERLYLIRELLDYIDIEIVEKKGFIELKFIEMEEEFDKTVFEKTELKILKNITEKYLDTTARNVANDTFKIEAVRTCKQGEIII